MTVVTKQDIKNTLTRLGIQTGDVVIFHSSLKSMGRVEGGAQAVIDAFLEQVGPEGTPFEPMFRQWGHMVSAPCGDAKFTVVDIRTFVDTLLEYTLKEPAVYTDVTNPQWIQWLLDVDDHTMTHWSKK